MSTTLRFAPGVADLESLGDAPAEAWLGAQAPALDARASLWSARTGEQHLRLPLPGTPGADGQRREPPRGAGTGWLHLHRYGDRGTRALAARLTAPRSTSLAARHWNLICHLRAAGVGAPELVVLGEGRPAVGPWSSFVVTRELDGFTPLDRLIEGGLAGRRRRLVLRSVGLALRGLFRAGAWLPQLTPADILVQTSAARDSEVAADCAALELENLRRDGRALRALGLRRTRLPGVAFTNFRRGRILGRVSRGRRARLLESLGRGLPDSVSRGERLAVFALATRQPRPSAR